jgi:hypothetical protein
MALVARDLGPGSASGKKDSLNRSLKNTTFMFKNCSCRSFRFSQDIQGHMVQLAEFRSETPASQKLSTTPTQNDHNLSIRALFYELGLVKINNNELYK